ncbi:hypothetical protein EYF80_044211 [Liparis tanakae]|uniref:Uncharacterized protein n=1 Tax=Liparis tanakae TaxID=230148 RepID=A0A4Z2FWI5_9TELE|nr:hypothetical protein EYF80_044211 [Liparis tanakae]
MGSCTSSSSSFDVSFRSPDRRKTTGFAFSSWVPADMARASSPRETRKLPVTLHRLQLPVTLHCLQAQCPFTGSSSPCPFTGSGPRVPSPAPGTMSLHRPQLPVSLHRLPMSLHRPQLPVSLHRPQLPLELQLLGPFGLFHQLDFHLQLRVPDLDFLFQLSEFLQQHVLRVQLIDSEEESSTCRMRTQPPLGSHELAPPQVELQRRCAAAPRSGGRAAGRREGRGAFLCRRPSTTMAVSLFNCGFAATR